jgi:Flp pilus assembly protein TadD
VELKPNDYDAHIGLGVALRGLRQLPRAQAEYERAMEIDANRPEAYFNLGLLYQDYMSGSIDELERAKRFYNQFMSKAGNNARYAEAVENVRRRCRTQRQGRGNRRRRRRRSTDCRPGRLQNIDTALEALRAAAEMQRQAERRGGGG